MKIQKRLAALGAALLLCFGFTMAVSAHEVPDLTRTGSITAAMTYEGEAVGGGTLTFYKVGDVAEDDGNYSFTLSEAFAGSGVSLEDLTDAGLAETLAEYAQANSLAGSEIAVASDGVWTASGLELGLYLIVQEEPADGFEAVAPFLVSVPMYENGTYVYTVSAEPKMGALTEAAEEPAPATPTTTTGTTLPQTGQLNWPVPVLTVLGLCLILAGWRLRVGKLSYEA